MKKSKYTEENSAQEQVYVIVKATLNRLGIGHLYKHKLFIK